MNSNEKRSCHPSSAQVETQVEFIERNPGMAKGFLRTQNARERSRRQWEEQAVRTDTPTPSRRGSTPVDAFVIRRRTAASSSSRHATPIASPSRRPRINMARANRVAGSVSSRHTSSVADPPPSQRQMEFFTTERFLRVKEQQLEIQRLNAQILQSFLERSAEREKILPEAVAAVGKGLQALAEAIEIGCSSVRT